MSASGLRCVTCGSVFAPFGGGNTNVTVAKNFSQHPCASTIKNRDEALRPVIVTPRRRQVRLAITGGVA